MGNSPVYAVGGPKLFGYATGRYGYNDGALQEGVLAPLQTTGSWYDDGWCKNHCHNSMRT